MVKDQLGQARLKDMGVNLGGGHIGMAQHCLDRPKVGPPR
tara:strand:- start:60 stop:179 length:120 start_codon:yes stop_codon:yes gene_type:complete